MALETHGGAGDLRSRDLFWVGETRQVHWRGRRGMGSVWRGRDAACLSQSPGRKQVAYANRIKESWVGGGGGVRCVEGEPFTTSRQGLGQPARQAGSASLA